MLEGWKILNKNSFDCGVSLLPSENLTTKKQSLQYKLQSLIKVKTESLEGSNELEEMRERPESRKLSMFMCSKVGTEDAKRQEERLSIDVRSLLVAGTAPSVSRKSLKAVSLVASYFEVPLCYPLRLGGSHTYIKDYAPSIEPTSSDLSSNTTLSTNTKSAEFPFSFRRPRRYKSCFCCILVK